MAEFEEREAGWRTYKSKRFGTFMKFYANIYGEVTLTEEILHDILLGSEDLWYKVEPAS